MATGMPDESTALRADPAELSYVPARVVWPLTGAIAIGMFALRLAYAISDLWSQEAGAALGNVMFEEVVGSVVSLPYVYGTIVVVRRWPLPRTQRVTWVLRLVACFVLASLFHAPLLYAVRGATAPLFGLEGYAFTPAMAVWINEAVNDILPVVAIVAGMTAAEYLLEARERERRAFALERSLLEAELSAVRLQLQPHFLFNALNTIAATMYDDPAAADAQLTQLSELLRASLRSTHAQEVPLREEVALVGQYMGLMQARFPGALTWQATLAPGTEELLVPSMSLQPLMENAVRHGALSARGAGRVQLTATILAGDARTAGEEATLELRVWDDGDGVAPGRDPIGAGTGLSATARRLHLLYGARGTLQARNAAGGGFEVVLQLPVRTMARGVDAARTRSASSLNATIPAAHGVASSRSVAG